VIPYYATPDGKVTLLHGHVLDVLREMPAESVNCVVTSPPYWSLRKYDCDPVVWGGDSACEHEWQTGVVKGECRLNEKMDKTGMSFSPRKTSPEAFQKVEHQHATCSLCGAWRGQYGLEPTPELYVEHTMMWLREVRRVLRKDGTCWINIGDGYAGGGNNSSNSKPIAAKQGSNAGAGSVGGIGKGPVGNGLKPKDAVLMPFRLALAAQADGWWVRSVIIWAKPNPMPESVRDRPTDAHEYIFLLTKSKTYWYDAEAIREEATEPRRCGTNSHANVDRDPAHGTRKQDAVGNRRYAGFNDRYDFANPPSGRNCRSVWTFPTEPFSEWTRTVRQVRVERDEVVDGTKRIASPDCPVHGDQDRRETRASCGEHEDGRCDGKQRTDSHPVQAQLDDCAPIDQPLGVDSQAGSSGLPRPECVPAATVRSSGSRRMGHVPATTPSCTPSEETAGRIEHTSVEPAMNAEHCPDTDGCNTSPDGKAARLPDQTQVHTVHKSSLPIPPDCSCSFYNEIAEQTSHFAVFPRELPERCMKAGCPEWVCPKCGKARVRVVEHQPAARNTNSPKDASRVALGMMSEKNRLCGPGWRKQAPEINETLGWTDCGCGAGLEADDLEIILTPIGEREGDDPSLVTGRAGYNRPRGANEGSRPITRYEQRRYAKQLHESGHRAEMETAAGPAFAHYLRTDKSGARPIPPELLQAWIECGWLERVVIPQTPSSEWRPGVVLDPFAGSGTTCEVAYHLGRTAIGIDASAKYLDMAKERVKQGALL